MKKILIAAGILAASVSGASALEIGTPSYDIDVQRSDNFLANAVDSGLITHQQAVDALIIDTSNGYYTIGTGWREGTVGAITRDARPHFGLAREVFQRGGF